MEHNRIDYADWMALASAEYARIIELIGGLDADDWRRPTDCEGWTVRDIVAHLAGAAEATASMREQLRQQREGKARQGDGDRMAAVNALQIAEREVLSTGELTEALADASARGVRARARIPGLVRSAKLSFPPPLGRASLGYLNGPVYTRDAWMHRLDVCRATSRAPVLTAEHDGRIVADLAAEWGGRGGIGVELTGPAGGRFGAQPNCRHDAIDFCRALAGRGDLDCVEPALGMF